MSSCLPGKGLATLLLSQPVLSSNIKCLEDPAELTPKGLRRGKCALHVIVRSEELEMSVFKLRE